MSRAMPVPEFTRRQSLIAGGLSLLGLTSAELSAMRAASAAPVAAKHRPNSCVFIFLFGGPSHIDLWDMKPEAPAEIRGEFQPVATNVPGISLCEHLPHLARQMDKLCLLRSMTHRMNVHGPACSEIYTGREYFGAPRHRSGHAARLAVTGVLRRTLWDSTRWSASLDRAAVVLAVRRTGQADRRSNRRAHGRAIQPVPRARRSHIEQLRRGRSLITERHSRRAVSATTTAPRATGSNDESGRGTNSLVERLTLRASVLDD